MEKKRMNNLIKLISILVFHITCILGNAINTNLVSNDEWKELQIIPGWATTLCIFGDIIVTAKQAHFNNMSYPVEESGVFIFLKQNGIFVYNQTIATDRFVFSCSLTSTLIALSAYPVEQQLNPIDYYVDVYEKDESSVWSFVQSITKPVYSSAVHLTDQSLFLVNVFKDIYGTSANCSVDIYQKNVKKMMHSDPSNKQVQNEFILTQQIKKKEFSIINYVVTSSLYEQTFILSGIPSEKSTTTTYCAQIYVLNTNSNQFELTQELDYLTHPVIGENILLSATTTGVDIYKNTSTGIWKYSNTFDEKKDIFKYRGTCSFYISTKSDYVVRNIQQYNLVTSTGCIVYSINNNPSMNQEDNSVELSIVFDNYGPDSGSYCAIGTNNIGASHYHYRSDDFSYTSTIYTNI